MKPTHKPQGDMLGKLMIAIIGISPAIAFSDNQNHAIRERVSAGLTLAGAAQTLVHDNMRTASPDFSRGWTGQGLSGLNDYIDSIRIDPATGVITVNYTQRARKISISLTPTAGGAGLIAGSTSFENISWRCAVSNESQNKYVPDYCRL
ncbi:MAG: pilin [Gammaproteobacteria bacterium]|jgi:type IV pilus assembly protein PilA